MDRGTSGTVRSVTDSTGWRPPHDVRHVRDEEVTMGTMDSSAFKDRERKDGSGKRDILFNGRGDGKRHGHVVQRKGRDGQTEYVFVRDVEGRVYIDERER
jgi:predicted metallo-beta-lactamase superfamily hydrolase